MTALYCLWLVEASTAFNTQELHSPQVQAAAGVRPQQAQLASGLFADLRLFLACRDDTQAREDESHKSEERRKASE